MTFIQDEYSGRYHNWDKYLVNPQLQNSYSYAANNPLKYNDPKGEFPALALPLAIPAGEAIIAAAGVAITAVTSAILSERIRPADPGNFKMDWRGLPTERVPINPKNINPNSPKWQKVIYGTILTIEGIVTAKLGWDKYKNWSESRKQQQQQNLQYNLEHAPTTNVDESKFFERVNIQAQN
ncbi:hypothetical protein KAU19_00970 [Candidatus Parcubacteria bacterium]|nr:hypothetical protein [Candidatus Parcubacteria bacterium]